MNTKLVIIRGNSGSGKTTAAKALQKRLGLGTLLVSQDVVRREMMYVKDGPDNASIELIKQIAMYGRDNSEYVIVEGITATKWYGTMFNELIHHFHNDYRAYYYDVSFEETVKRHKTKPNAHEFGEEEMKRWWNEKDFLNLEKEKRISDSHSVSDTIELILDDLEFQRT